MDEISFGRDKGRFRERALHRPCPFLPNLREIGSRAFGDESLFDGIGCEHLSSARPQRFECGLHASAAFGRAVFILVWIIVLLVRTDCL